MSALKPDAVNTHDLGTTSLPWKALHVDEVKIGARTGVTGSKLTIGSQAKLDADPSVPVDLEVFGSLTVHGSTTTISSSELVVEDKTITIASGSADSAAADGAGLIVDGAGASLLYDHAGTQWEFNKPLEVLGNVLPQTSATYDLGSTTLGWNDLHLASGGIVNFANGNATITHSNTGLLLNAGVNSLDLQADSASTFTVDASGGNAKDLTLSITGATDSSLILSSSGTGSDAIKLSTSAGSIDIDSQSGITLNANSSLVLESNESISLGQSGEGQQKPVTINSTNFDLNATGSLTSDSATVALTVTQTFDLDADGAITLDASSVSIGSDNDTGSISLNSTSSDLTLQTSTSGKIHLNSVAQIDLDAPTGLTIDTTSAGADIVLDAQLGSVLIDSGENDQNAIKLHASNVEGGIVLSAGTGNIALDTTGNLILSSSKNATDSIQISSSNGGIDILATAATAGEDIDIISTGSSINISATESISDAITLTASGVAGGIELDSGTGGLTLTTAGTVSLTSSKAASDALILSASDATGGINLNVAGSTIVSIDPSLVTLTQDLKITGSTPTLTIGDAGEEDTSLIFDGNSFDFYVGLDDSDDKLKLGLGSVVGTTPNITLESSSRDVILHGDLSVEGGKITLSNGAVLDSETNGLLLLTEDLVKTSGNLEVTGNLVVKGDTITLNTATLDVEDKNITLNKGGLVTSGAGAGIDIEENNVITGYLRVADDDRANLDLKAPGGNELKLDINADSLFTILGNLTIESASILNQDLTTDAAVQFGSLTSNGGVTVDNITIDGTEIDLSSGSLTLDVAADIKLDADGGNLEFLDGGVSLLKVSNSSLDVVLQPQSEDKDIIFKEDGGNEIARFDSSSESLLLASSKKLMLGAPEEFLYGDGTDLFIGVGEGGNINIPQDIGLSFASDDTEKIESDGTNLTISSGEDINLSATSDVNIPEGVGLSFATDDAEKIESNGTDLTISSGGKIILSTTESTQLNTGSKIDFGGLDEIAIKSDNISGLELKASGGAKIIKINSTKVEPSADSTTDLGSSDKQYKDIFVDNVKLRGQGGVYFDADGGTYLSASNEDDLRISLAGIERLSVDLSAGVSYFAPISSVANAVKLGKVDNPFDSLTLKQTGEILFADPSLGGSNKLKVSHVTDEGLAIKNLNTTDAGGLVLTLQTGDTAITTGDVLGSLEFQAPDEASGTDAVLVSAAISAVAEGDFTSTSNATKLSFKTGSSELASEKMSLSSSGLLTLTSAGLVTGGGIIIPNTSSIGSAGDTDAITISASGVVNITSGVVSTSSTTGALIVTGGVGISDDLHVGDDLFVSGDLSVSGGSFVSETTVKGADFKVQTSLGVDRVTLTSSGNISAEGSLNIKGNSTLGDNVNDTTSVSGNLVTSGAFITQKIVSGTATTLNAQSYIYLVTSDNQTITLPSSSGLSGLRYIIKQTAAYTSGTTIDANGSETIDGSLTITLASRYAFVEIICDGSNWHIIAQGGTVNLN